MGIVRGGCGDAEAIGDLLAKLSDDERWALPVVLAAMVDHDRTPDELLSWISFDEHGRPLRSPRTVSPRWHTVAECGTPGAYARHLAAGEEPDLACEAAERDRLARAARGKADRKAARQEPAA